MPPPLPERAVVDMGSERLDARRVPAEEVGRQILEHAGGGMVAATLCDAGVADAGHALVGREIQDGGAQLPTAGKIDINLFDLHDGSGSVPLPLPLPVGGLAASVSGTRVIRTLSCRYSSNSLSSRPSSVMTSWI